MTEQQIEELVYQIWLATGAEDDATKPPIRQAIIQAINMTKDEDARIALTSFNVEEAEADIVRSKIKET